MINGKPGYATSDLIMEHPNRPGFWKIMGRVDDQIMLSIGEKTNPGPLGWFRPKLFIWRGVLNKFFHRGDY